MTYEALGKRCAVAKEKHVADVSKMMQSVKCIYVYWGKTVMDYESTFSFCPLKLADSKNLCVQYTVQSQINYGLKSLWNFLKGVWLYDYHIKLSFADFVNYHPVRWLYPHHISNVSSHAIELTYTQCIKIT